MPVRPATTYASNRIAEQTVQRSQPSPINRQRAATIRFNIVIGKTNFHAKFINWSCRSRGRGPRSQINTQIESMTLPKNHIHEGTNCRNENGADHPPRNRVVPRPEIENIPRYSPRKNNANLNPEYSVK